METNQENILFGPRNPIPLQYFFTCVDNDTKNLYYRNTIIYYLYNLKN